MDEEANIYGTVVKRTVMEEDPDCSRDRGCRHSSDTIHYTKKSSMWSTTLLLSTATMTLAGSIPVGYIIAASLNPYHMEDDWVRMESSTLRTLLLVGGVMGALLSLALADCTGRRRCVLTSSVVAVVGAALHVTASVLKSTDLLVTSWLTFGLSIGACVSILPLYLVEVAPSSLRTSLGATFTVGTTVGALLSQTLSLHCSLGIGKGYPLLLPIFVVPVFVSWFLYPYVPESPMYLFFVKKDSISASSELARLRGVEIISADSELEEHNPGAKTSDYRSSQQLKQYTLVIMVCAAHLSQALGGADQIYHLNKAKLKLAEEDLVAANYTARVTNCITALVLVHLVSVVSWRALLIFSSLVSSVLLLLVASSSLDEEYNGDMQYLMLVALLVQVVIFDFGLRPIPYFLVCELFDTSLAAKMMAVGGAVNFTGLLISDQLMAHLNLSHFRLFAAFILALLALFLLLTPKNELIRHCEESNTPPPRPERTISYLPNPHRVPGVQDKYRRKSLERKDSQSL